jgi:hypothetical protein
MTIWKILHLPPFVCLSHGACSSSILSPLGSFHHALFINVENFYTHIKDMEKVLIKLVVVQSYHENEWNQVIINKENNNC